MIGKVTRGSSTRGLLRYLYGPGRANEHRDPHLVASWLGDEQAVLAGLEPGPGRDLAGRLDVPLGLLPDRPRKHVWQCSMRAADADRRLSDREWAAVAREVVERTGFAPAGDPGACRWVAVRHADDHVHVVVTLARQDGGPVRVFRDWPKVHAAARAVERRFGLVTVDSPDRSATVAPSRGEQEKARRVGEGVAARAWLAREVRVVAAGTLSREEFERGLLTRSGLVVRWRASVRTPGEVTGYSVGRVGDVDRAGRQVWYSGSKLAPDLSLPKLTARWHEGGGAGWPRDQVFAQAQARLRLAGRGPVGAAAAVSAGEVGMVLADLVEGRAGGELTRAAEGLARAARLPGGVRPAEVGAHDLRGVASGLYRLGALGSGEIRDAMVTAAHLVRIADALRSGPGARVGRRSAAAVAVRGLRGRIPVRAEQIEQIRAALPQRWAEEVLRDPAVPLLADRLRLLSAQGRDAVALLGAAFRSREVASAESVAAVLDYRLGSRNAPRPARASMAAAPLPRRDRGR